MKVNFDHTDLSDPDGLYIVHCKSRVLKDHETTLISTDRGVPYSVAVAKAHEMNRYNKQWHYYVLPVDLIKQKE